MKLAIMQPYFFPFLGHFDLINRVDEWIAFDTPQYIRHHWINRNRILHPDAGWQYIIVPLRKHHRDIPINQVQIAMEYDWRGKILRQLHHYRMKAPYYQNVTNFLQECFSEASPNLSETNIHTLRKTCRKLGIDTPIHVFSQMDLVLDGKVEGPGDWALRISNAAGASEYVNASRGAVLFNEGKFTAHHIKLSIQSYSHMVYSCGPYQFEPGLSIIDVMMWNSCEEIKHYLDTLRQKMSDEEGQSRLESTDR
jgi:hypothetical protein